MRNELVQQWRKSGVQEGDVLLIHSGLKRTLLQARELGLTISPKEILESFLEAVGSNGTLVVPLFNFDFTQGVPFDIRSTPSRMGALTEVARLYPNSIRTGHPIYSFAAIGSHAEAFRKIDNRSGYGADSPFAVLRALDGKIGILNLTDQDSMTFYHHVEEMLNVPYRYHKEFDGLYTDTNGHTSERTYSLFVRDLKKGILTDVDRMGEFLWKKGLYQGDRHNVDSGFRTILARELFRATESIINEGKAIDYLYSIDSTALNSSVD